MRMTFIASLLSASAAAMQRLPARARVTSPRMAASLGGPEITVLGGGFGGLYTALRLRSLDWSGGPEPRVTLVDRNDRFCFSPMLYELATGTATSWEVAPTYEDLLEGTDIDFVRGDVTGLDEDERVVRVADASAAERLLPYDHCVLAFGARANIDSVPGATEHALPFVNADDALAVKARVKELQAESADGAALRLSVVGGGYIGVELAANLCAAPLHARASAPRAHAEHTKLAARVLFFFFRRC